MLLHQRDALERLISQVQSPDPAIATDFVRHVMAHLMRSDGVIGSEEMRMLSDFNRDGLSWTEEVEYARDLVSLSPDFLTQLPPFFVAAVAHDREHDSEISTEMIRCIGALCRAVVECDGIVHEKENAGIATLVSTLRNAQVELPGSSAERA